MPRRTRPTWYGTPLHVMHRGHNRSPIFSSDSDYEWFLHFLRQAARKQDVSVHAFALMTTHVHLIVSVSEFPFLSRMMQSIALRYTRHFNRTYERIGSLWNERFRALEIADERYALTCLRYVEQNPVRAGIVKHPQDYRWSSYSAHGFGNWPSWLVPHPVYLALGGTSELRQRAYRALCARQVNPVDAAAFRRTQLYPVPDPVPDPGSNPELDPVLHPDSDPGSNPGFDSVPDSGIERYNT